MVFGVVGGIPDDTQKITNSRNWMTIPPLLVLMFVYQKPSMGITSFFFLDGLYHIPSGIEKIEC